MSKRQRDLPFHDERRDQDVVEQLAPGRVFEDYTDILVRLDHVVEPDDVGVFEGLPSPVKCGRKVIRVM